MDKRGKQACEQTVKQFKPLEKDLKKNLESIK